MKKIHFIFTAVLSLTMMQSDAQRKVQYNIPEQLSDADKKQLKSTLKKGMKLYKKNCTGCHGIFAKGKDGVPNFTQKQIEAYKTMFILMDPMNHAVAQKMPPPNLNAILTFLQYRKIQR